MWKKVLIAVAALVVVILLYASTRPDTFEVKRSIVIKAPEPEVFVYIHDFHNWQAWSPWEKLDPEMKREFGGAENGVGATYSWKGNSEVGKGSMEITAVEIPNRVRIQLDFTEPFKARNLAEFTIIPNEGATEVTWTMSGTYSKPAKLMSVFFDMDSMVGGDFETGLANLKAVVESGAAK